MNKNTSLYRAAVLLKSLPKAYSAKILARLEGKDLRELIASIDKVKQVSTKQLIQTFEQFVESSEKAKSSSPASTQPESLIETHAAETHDSYSFDFLIDVLPEIQIHLLENEHPKNIAMVLSMLPTGVGSILMNGLEAEMRVGVLRRLCQTDEFDLNEIRDLSLVLKTRLDKLTSDKNYRQKGVDIASKLLSCVDDKTLDSIMVYLNQEDPELAEKLEHTVFKFEDIKKLPNKHVKTILRNTDTSLWAPALKGACLETRKHVLKNLGPVPSTILSNELAQIGPLPHGAIDDAQHQIVNICLHLNDKGKISIHRHQYVTS